MCLQEIMQVQLLRLLQKERVREREALQSMCVNRHVLKSMHVFDALGLNKDLKDIEDKIFKFEKLSSPFFLLSINDSPRLQKINAEKWFKNEFYSSNNILEPISNKQINEKIKIGYYSADFRDHAMGHLLANLFVPHSPAPPSSSIKESN